VIKGEVVIDLTPLEGLRKTLVSRILRKAVTEAGRVVRTAVKGNADTFRRTGGMAKAIGIKVKTYSERKTAVAIVGPRSKWQRELGVRTRGKHRGETIVYRPSKIAHIIERGGRRTRAKPFLKAALDSTQGQYLDTLSNALRRAIEQQLSTGKS
jgi:hypothetical protein